MKIPIQVSADSSAPMYLQIEEQLRALILSGELKEGTMLPSIREFAQGAGCSVITIRRVYQDLENEGILLTRQGTGTFVAKVGDTNRERYRRDAVIAALVEAIETGRSLQSGIQEMRDWFEEALKKVYTLDDGE
ncbi:GntR family transcriptional regulator [Paenibacillus turpanensis]|uniref:GntR family transcriptional regulator n=1 Tax=Paenibacillus turpanensis TaxID=2689078 RepID=UPI001409C22E|nr:GntR family transcriptional regulator [Paenibacillus turpanensis]